MELLLEYDLPHLDLHEITTSRRAVTQTVAADLYDRGASAVRFPSHLDGNACIALFEGRGAISSAGTPSRLSTHRRYNSPTSLRRGASRWSPRPAPAATTEATATPTLGAAHGIIQRDPRRDRRAGNITIRVTCTSHSEVQDALPVTVYSPPMTKNRPESPGSRRSYETAKSVVLQSKTSTSRTCQNLRFSNPLVAGFLATATILSEALVDGFSSAFLVGAIFAVLGLVASLTLIRRDELEPQTLPALEKEPALDAA